MDASALPGGTWPLDAASHLREHLLWMDLRGRARRTLLARRRAVVRLAEHLDHDPLHATYDELSSWQEHLLGTSRKLVRHQTALVRPYYRWLRDRGYRLDDPAALLPLPRIPRGLPRPIAEQVLARIIGEAPPRLLPWLLLAGWSGLRAGEIAELRVDSFRADPEGYWVRVVGKGGTVRDAPIPSWAWPTISAALAPTGAAWRRQRGFGPVTPQHVSQYCNEYLHRAGAPDTLHSLRHRVGTITYQQTRDIRLVQELLGHLDIGTTAIYTRVAPQKIAEAVAELPATALPTPRPAGRRLRVLPRLIDEGTA